MYILLRTKNTFRGATLIYGFAILSARYYHISDH